MVQVRCSLVLLGALLLCACDRQVDREYQGESLLRIEGNVVIPLGLEGGSLVPAIAFTARSEEAQRHCARPAYDHLRYVNVGVSGDFPSSFRLDVFDPPPPEALRRVEPGGLEIAIGYITALAQNHPRGVLTMPISQRTFEEWPSNVCVFDEDDEIDVAGGDAGPPAASDPRPPSCIVVHTCTLDASRCLDQTMECYPEGSTFNYSDCELKESEGDETLQAAGYSLSHRVVYFSQRVAAGSPTAERYAGGESIAAGYHLYRFTRPATTEPELKTCLAKGPDAAFQRYNAEHGTMYNPIHLTLGYLEDEDAIDYPTWVMLRCELNDAIEPCFAALWSLEEVTGETISIELGALGP